MTKIIFVFVLFLFVCLLGCLFVSKFVCLFVSCSCYFVLLLLDRSGNCPKEYPTCFVLVLYKTMPSQTFTNYSILAEKSCPENVINPNSTDENLEHVKVVNSHLNQCFALVPKASVKSFASLTCKYNGGRTAEVVNEQMQLFLEGEIRTRVALGELKEANWWIGAVADSEKWVIYWTDGEFFIYYPVHFA